MLQKVSSEDILFYARKNGEGVVVPSGGENGAQIFITDFFPLAEGECFNAGIRATQFGIDNLACQSVGGWVVTKEWGVPVPFGDGWAIVPLDVYNRAAASNLEILSQIVSGGGVAAVLGVACALGVVRLWEKWRE